MRRTVLWVMAVLAAASIGAIVGVSWRDRTAPSTGDLVSPPGEPHPAGTGTTSPTPPAAAPPAAAPPGAPFLQIEGTTLSAADSAGQRLWELRASQLTMDGAKQRVVLRSVSGRFYAGGSLQMTFSAPSAVFDVTSRDVEMTGGVVGRAADGRVLRASRVRWSAGAREIRAAGTVVLSHRGVAITSDQLTADAGLDQVRFSGNVLVRVTE